MAIQIQCPGCQAMLQVDESLAGKQGRCIHCGHRVTVPALGNTATQPTALPLSEASPEAMMRELHERGESALLLVFKPSADGSYNLADMPDEAIRCIVTEDVNQARFAKLVDGIGKRFGGRRRKPISTGLPLEDQPYELKGDRLGMTLDDFKAAYTRNVEGRPERLPLCSDQAWGESRALLQVQPWHRAAGIIHARVDLPSENSSPTIAGVKTELVLYQFVDGRLYRISAFFPTDLFHMVSEALIAKYGPPAQENDQPRQLMWENRYSSIVLTRGMVHPPEASTLHFTHKELGQIVESRVPQAAQDI